MKCPKCQSNNPEKKKFPFLYKRTWIIFLLIAIFTSGSSLRTNNVKTLWSISYFGEDDFFHRPSDIELDLERALVYVADSGNHRVLVFDFQGEFLKIIGNKGQGPAEFSNPTGLFILEDGGLAVADVGNLRIQIFDKDGEFVESINTKGVQVADMIFKDDKIYTISCFGSSGYARLDMRSEKDSQPLVKILDNQGNLIQSISVDDFPESHPFLRAIKHRVCLALSKDGKLYIPHYAMNVIHIFSLEGKKLGEFDRSLPFKPGDPKIVKQISKDGIIRMQATFDFITEDAKIGPDGNLYLLTYTESYMDRAKRKDKGMDLPPHPVRIDVIDTKSHELVRHIECDADTRAFALADENRIVYVYVDSEGEVILKCIQF